MILYSFRIDWLDLLAVLGLSRVFSSTIQKHQFFGTQPSLWFSSHLVTFSLVTFSLVIFSLVTFFPRKWTSFWTFPKDSTSTSRLRGPVEFSSKGPPAYWALSFRSSLLGSETQLCP